MIIFDDKTKGVVESSDGRIILPVFKPCEDVTFKASYIVASDVECNGKITALFDLTVLGNLKASELDVKGKFICIGKCVIDDSLIAQHDIWVDDIRASVIESRDRIIAQGIDAEEIKADGDIVVGKCLAIEGFAFSGNNIICGETAYGAGKVAAVAVITGEPIDLDEGANAVINPNIYKSDSTTKSINESERQTASSIIPTFIPTTDWSEYLGWLISNTIFKTEKEQFKSWMNIISSVDALVRIGIDSFRDLSTLIWITGIAFSDYFKGSMQVQSLQKKMDQHFASVLQTDKSSIICSLENYGELLQALEILNRYGNYMDKNIYDFAFEILVSNFGLKSKFITERLIEKGWKAHG
jgi:hypothetical protein